MYSARKEMSVTSRSVTEEDNNFRKSLKQGTYGKIDFIFPLFEGVFRAKEIPMIFTELVVDICALQFLATALWPSIPELITFDDGIGKFYYYFFSILNFCDIRDTDFSNLIFFIVEAIIVALILIFLFSFLYHFKIKRNFKKWQIYTSKFFFEVLVTVSFTPSIRYTGSALYRIIENPTSLNVVEFIVSAICMIIISILFYFHVKFICMTPYLSMATTVAWNGNFTFMFISLTAFSQFFPYFFRMFDFYITSIWIIIRFVFDIYIVYRSRYMPFVHTKTNSLLSALYVAMAALDLACFASYTFKFKIPNLAFLIGMFGLLLIFLVIMTIIYHKTIKRISEFLNVVIETNAEKDEHFDSKHLYKDAQLCELYMRVGLSQHCRLFLDWSLVKYVVEAHPQSTISCLRYISFFPSETRLSRQLLSKACKMNRIPMASRFLIFQVSRINTLRSSSSSSDITERLMELDSASRQLISTVSGFWKAVPSDPSCLYEIKKKVEALKSKFLESIDNWPNNPRLYEFYFNFLVEAATEYKNSLLIKNRLDLVERGKNLVTDLSFYSLLKCYPDYVRKNIIDSRGHISRKVRKPNSSSSESSTSESNATISSGTIDGVLENEIEEQLAKQSFLYPKLRLAYEASISTRTSQYEYNQKSAAIWTFLVMIAVLLFTFFFFQNFFSNKMDNVNRLMHMELFRLGYDQMMHLFMIEYVNYSFPLPQDLLDQMRLYNYGNHYDAHNELAHDPNLFQEYLDQNNISNLENYWTEYSQQNLDLYSQEMILLASSNYDPNLTTKIFGNEVLYTSCYQGTQLYFLQETTLTSLVSYNLLNAKFVISLKEGDFDWSISEEVCYILVNIKRLDTAYNETAQAILDFLTAESENNDRKILILEIVIIVVSLLISGPVLLFFSMRFYNALIDLLTNIMRSIDPESQEEATKPISLIMKQDDQQDFIVETVSSKTLSRPKLIAIIFIPILITEVIFIVTIYIIKHNNKMFLYYNKWIYYTSCRIMIPIEITAFYCISIAIENNMSTTVTQQSLVLGLIQNLTNELSSINNIILNGDTVSNLPTLIGRSDDFDSINLNDVCQQEIGEGDISYYTSYRCLSLNRLILFFVELSKTIIESLETQKLTADSDYFHLFNVTVYHIYQQAATCANIVQQMAQDQLDTYTIYLSCLCFCGVAYMIVALAFYWHEISKLNIAYKGSILLLRRLPPQAVINNNSLYNFLIHKKQDVYKGKLTAAMKVFHLSNDAVICLNKNQIIEVVNPATTHLFGHKPEQLLGQPISFLINDKNIEQQIALMKEGESAMVYECSSAAMNDDDQPVSVHVNLIGITDSHGTKSFVVILRDETELLKRRTDAEEAKASSEKLLYSILPRDIVTRLNRGESDISFDVPKATIIFVDIVKFSEYSKTLTPSQIMENLSTIFAQFDILCGKYALMTKIKLIGDVYMAAAGLFSPEDQAQNAAAEVINFGLDVLPALDEINGLLESSLTVRIGVNTDGPLIAGVLGKDKPVFDIIGDPINVAARLQSNGIPGTVQISSTTYELIASMHFNVEERGLIELKGKGKKMAYLVRPGPSGSIFLRDQNNLKGALSMEFNLDKIV